MLLLSILKGCIGFYAEALTDIEDVIENSKDDWLQYHIRGLLLFAMDDHLKAHRSFTLAYNLLQGQTTPALRVVQGKVLSLCKGKSSERAKGVLEQFVSSFDNEGKVHEMFGDIFLTELGFAAAIEFYRKAKETVISSELLLLKLLYCLTIT